MTEEIENTSTLDLRVNVPTDTASLTKTEEALRSELSAAIELGNVTDILRIENTLKHFPSLRRAAESRELRERLDAIANELKELRQDQTMLEALRAEKNRVVAKTIEKLEKEKIDVAKCEASLFGVDVRRQNNLDERRQLTKRLADLKSNFSDRNAGREIGNNNNLENLFGGF